MNFGDLTANQDMAQLPGTTAGTNAGTGKIGEIFLAGIPGGGPVGGVLHKINADNAPAYADGSKQERQDANVPRRIAIAAKKRRYEKQDSTDANDQMIDDVDVHSASTN